VGKKDTKQHPLPPCHVILIIDKTPHTHTHTTGWCEDGGEGGGGGVRGGGGGGDSFPHVGILLKSVSALLGAAE